MIRYLFGWKRCRTDTNDDKKCRYQKESVIKKHEMIGVEILN